MSVALAEQPLEQSSDEALAAAVAAGDARALGALHRRHGPALLRLATLAVPAQADEVVQDTFIALWNHASSFDSSRGSFRPWLLQIARNQVAHALRSGRRRAAAESLAGWDASAAEWAQGRAPAPDEALWQASRQRALRVALDELPEPQRRALGLAFLGELSHEEVASALALPLGTAKTRIRAGLLALRSALGPLAGVTLVVGGAWLLVRWREADSEHEALALVTSSTAEAVRLTASETAPAGRHGTFRRQKGKTLGVLTLTDATPGADVTVWARQGTAWTALGTVRVGSDGRALAVFESSALTAPLDELRVTRGQAPESELEVKWTRP